MLKEDYKAPALSVQPIDIDDIVSQKVNPNSQTEKSWDSLQISILNSGFVFGVLVGNNHEYDPSTEGKPKPSLLTHSDGELTNTGDIQIGTQVSDDEVAKYFKYRLIDGSHRSQIIRLGKYYCEHGYDNSDNWYDGKEIPTKPGKELLAYLAWRENFTIPAVVLHQSKTDQLSTEVLMNSAVGSASLDGEKELINRMLRKGKSQEWIIQNLGINPSTVEIYAKKSQLEQEYSDIDDCSSAWNSKEQNSVERKENAYLIREATKYTFEYQKKHPNDQIQDYGSAVEIAESIGFDVDKAIKDFNNRNVNE